MTQPSTNVELLVCTKCRQGDEAPEGAERPGARLFRRLSADGPEGVTVTPVECLSNCAKGCTVALRGAGRWTYVYGGFDADGDLGALVEGAGRYRGAEDGLVPWRERPEHFRRNCVARLPPLA